VSPRGSVTGPALAVTGSTGALGGLVARGLAERGTSQRLLARSPERTPSYDGAVAVPCSFGDRAGALAALDGVETLLMVSASESADRLEQHRTFVGAAAEAGVRRVVYTSFAGAAPDCTFTLGRDHWATEEAIRSTGMSFTFLRDSFYLDFLSLMVGDDRVIRGPAGEGLLAGVARADVARVAVEVLLAPADHAGASYTLTGPEALSMTEIATILTEETGRPVRFHDETLAEAYESRRRWKAPDWQNDAWVSTYTAIKAGEVATVTDDVRRVTGAAPLSLRDLVRGAA
jgi:NAD(P)H dehydrogenase (quinone)